jgi:hypothetical protein
MATDNNAGRSPLASNQPSPYKYQGMSTRRLIGQILATQLQPTEASTLSKETPETMCIAAWIWQAHPVHQLLLLLNRDELHSRYIIFIHLYATSIALYFEFHNRSLNYLPLSRHKFHEPQVTSPSAHHFVRSILKIIILLLLGM